ncbi:hypothetical protein LGQ02_08980 [Bacillus shivajii]|uniref:hypothetical protein n=1 Tax=Bacillus shivajii TaxID=1983719 RepID=UPI001CFBB49D|nr:hypothetical protein [Bacillus shivajii]UCZ54858.1 hypothetical protein LGQ02_08980 [Bacillus shivajii]
MKKLLCVCSLIIAGITLFGCGSSNMAENNDGEKEVSETNEKKQYDSVIEEIRDKAMSELDIKDILVPEMEELEIKNAFVTFSGEEPFSVDVQYHAEVSDKDERYENEVIVEEEKEKTGMKHLVPPYVNAGDMYFWLAFSKLDMPEMLNNEEGGISEDLIEIEANEVLFRNNGTDYQYFIAVDEGHYMFSYNIEHYSQEEVEKITSKFIEKIKSGEYS